MRVQGGSVRFKLNACENPSEISTEGHDISDYFRILLCTVAFCLMFDCLSVILHIYLPPYLSVILCVYVNL